MSSKRVGSTLGVWLRHPPAWIALLFGVVAVSTASIFINRAQAAGVSSLAIAAYRLTLASLILSPLALRNGLGELARLTRRDMLLALASGACLGLHFITWISSLGLTSIASSVVLVTTSPLMVALASPLVLREPLRPAMLAGVVVACVGGILIGLADRGAGQADSLLGDLLALAGALFATGYFLAGRRLRVKLSLLPYIFVVYGTAAVLVDLLALLQPAQLFAFAPSGYLWLILLALVPQLVGHSTFNWALRHASATLATVPVLGEPVGATLLAALILGQIPGPLTLAGGLLVLAGIFLVTYYGARAATVRIVPAAGDSPGDKPC